MEETLEIKCIACILRGLGCVCKCTGVSAVSVLVPYVHACVRVQHARAAVHVCVCARACICEEDGASSVVAGGPILEKEKRGGPV